MLVPNFHSVVTIKGWSRLSKVFSCKNNFDFLHKFTRFTISSLTLRERHSVDNSAIRVCASKSRNSHESKDNLRLPSMFKFIFLWNYRLNFFQQRLSWKLQIISQRKTQIEKTDLVLCIKILIVQNFQKIVIKNDSSQIWKWCFCVNTGLLSFIRVAISNIKVRKKAIDSIFSQLFFLQQSLATPKNRTFYPWLLSIFSLIFLYNQGLIPSSKISSQKNETFAVIFSEIITCFDPCLKSLIVRWVQNMLTVLTQLHIQPENSL